MKRTFRIVSLTGLLLPAILQGMSGASVRTLLNGQFQPAIKDAQQNGVTLENLTKACNAINSGGIAGYANYFSEWYVPFVQTFGAPPATACSASNLSAMPTIVETLTMAVPSRGGRITAETEQMALQAVQSYIKNGGSPFAFAPDVDALIAGLVIGSASTGMTTTGTTNIATDSNIIKIATNLKPFYTQASLMNGSSVNIANLVQCSQDFNKLCLSLPTTIGASTTPFATWSQKLITALSNPSATATTPQPSNSNVATNQNVLQIAQAFDQSMGGGAFYLSEDGTSIADMNLFIQTILQINNINDDLNNPTSAFGMIDKQLAIYNNGSDPSFTITDNYSRFNMYTSPIEWGAQVAGICLDTNNGYTTLAAYDETNGSYPISGFTYNESLDLGTLISEAISAVEGTAGTGTSTTAVDFLTNSTLITVAKALSGINYLPSGSPEKYITTNGDLDPNQLKAMGIFANQLRGALNIWMGSDPSTACDPMLSFTLNTFNDYVAAMNGAVADETDILQQLPSIFSAIGEAIGDPNLTYDIMQTPSYNIYGDFNGVNGNGLYACMYNWGVTQGSGESSSPSETLTLNNSQSLAALATMLADQIENHNQAVAYITARCGQLKEAFTDTPTNSTTLTYMDGSSSTVSGARSTTSSRTVAQEVFHDIVNEDKNGMLALLNNQAAYLQRQANGLISAGASSFTTTDGTSITSISYFTNTTVTVGTTSVGTMNVTSGSVALT